LIGAFTMQGDHSRPYADEPSCGPRRRLINVCHDLF
jgi:hypothetical protein